MQVLEDCFLQHLEMKDCRTTKENGGLAPNGHEKVFCTPVFLSSILNLVYKHSKMIKI
jgi:hypothetical protein